MSRVLSWLYLGGKKDARDRDWLIETKVASILNVTP